MSHAPHSDLEVAPNTDAPEVQKFAYYAPEPYKHDDTDTHKFPYATETEEQNHARTICGLRRRTSWIALIVAIIVVAAAVGGGVGSTLVSKSSSSNSTTSKADAPQSEASIPSTTPTPTSVDTKPNITTTSIVGPSSTILRDCPSSNDTLYDVTHGDTRMSFRKECDISFVNVNGIDNAFGKPVQSLNDCIDLCAAFNINNRTQIAAGTSRICNAVCWRNTFDKINDWAGGMCFGFTSQNSSGTFRYKLPAETRCDSAALINQAF
jgi:hypothetical protein